MDSHNVDIRRVGFFWLYEHPKEVLRCVLKSVFSDSLVQILRKPSTITNAEAFLELCNILFADLR
jgi:hypothetical protein